MVRYAEIVKESIVDGLGMRVAAFLQGCPRHCRGCHNEKLLPLAGGHEVAVTEFAALLLDSITPLHQGITFTGGDPLIQAEALLEVVQIIKSRQPSLDIWVYTGFTFAEVQHLPLLRLINVLVDGPFVAEQRDLGLPLRGSTNQKIINVPASLQTGHIVEILVGNVGAFPFSQAV